MDNFIFCAVLEDSFGLMTAWVSLQNQIFAFDYILDFLLAQIFANAEFFIFYPLKNVTQNFFIVI